MVGKTKRRIQTLRQDEIVYVGNYYDLMKRAEREARADDGMADLAAAAFEDALEAGSITQASAQIFVERLNQVPYKAIGLKHKMSEGAARVDYHRTRAKIITMIEDAMVVQGHGRISEGQMIQLLILVFRAKNVRLAGRI